MDIALLRYAHLMETIAKNNPAFGRSIESGLERVSTDHEFLVHAFSQVLESLGVTGASKLLKERNFSEPGVILDPQTIHE